MTVRVVLMSILVMLAAPRAEAWPTVSAAGVVPRETRGAPAGAASMLQLVISRAARPLDPDDDRLTGSLRSHVVPRARSIEMPWIWQVLRHNVYARMPRYDRVAQRGESRFSFVLSPVVVSSPQDTVPGVGVEGDF